VIDPTGLFEAFPFFEVGDIVKLVEEWEVAA
jgi:hypothetical protein